MTTKFRNWVFTLNNYTEDEVKAIGEIECRYCIYGKEVGEGGTPHLQGTIVFKSQLVFSSIKKLLPDRCHIEVCKALPESIEYCKKDGDVTERGDKPLNSNEKGLAEKDRWALALKQAREVGEVDDDRIELLHGRAIEFAYNKARKKVKYTNYPAKHLWYWGTTGTGKSTKAWETYPDAFDKMPTKWWDGYANEEVVIIEEMDPKHDYMGYFIKRWADKFPFAIEMKGTGGQRIRPKLIIVTSNYHPRDIFNDVDIGPILRRFTVTEFKSLDHGSSSLGL